jgi:hypothetical protein
MPYRYLVSPYAVDPPTFGRRGRHVAISDDFPSQRPGEAPLWREAEAGQNHAVVLVESPQELDLSSAMARPGVSLMPNIDPHLRLDQLTAQEVSSIADVIESLGVAPERAARTLRQPFSGDLSLSERRRRLRDAVAGQSLYQALRAALTARRRVRLDGTTPVYGDALPPGAVPLPRMGNAVLGDWREEGFGAIGVGQGGLYLRFGGQAESPAVDWTSLGADDFKIEDGVLTGDASEFPDAVYEGSNDTHGPDVEASVVVTDAGFEHAIRVRVSDVGSGGDYYTLYHNGGGSNSLLLRRGDNGTETTLGPAMTLTTNSGFVADGDEMIIRAEGSTLVAGWRPSGDAAFTEYGRRTDSTYATAGKVGLYASMGPSTMSYDDLRAGTRPERPPNPVVVGRRVDTSIAIRQSVGEFIQVGRDVDRGINFEGLVDTYNEQGPDTANFVLRRDPSVEWPDIQAYNELTIRRGGIDVWSGRIEEAAGQSGDSFTLSVKARGWQYHLDDDKFRMGWVHSKVSDWRDLRTFPGVDPEHMRQYFTLRNDGGVPWFGWQSDAVAPSASGIGHGVGIGLDLGQNGDYAVRMALVYERSNAAAGSLTLFGRGTTGDEVTGTINDYDEFIDPPIVHSSLTAPGSGPPYTLGVAGGVNTNARRSSLNFLSIFLWYSSGGGALTLDYGVKCMEIRCFSEENEYSSGNDIDLNASDIPKRLLRKGKLPLITDDESQIEATSFIVPHYWSFTPQTARSYIQGVNAFHDYLWGVDVQKRLYFRARPDAPRLEIGKWTGATFRDASTNSGQDVYNKVIVNGTGPVGEKVVIERAVSTAGTPYGELMGSGTATNFSTSGIDNDVLTVTISTPPLYGEIWTVEIDSLAITGTDPYDAFTLQLLTDSDVFATASRRIDSAGQLDGWQVSGVVPFENDLGTDVEARLVCNNGNASDIDVTMSVYRARGGLISRNRFVRAGSLNVSAPLPRSAIIQIADIWLANNQTTPLKGAVTAEAQGGVREIGSHAGVNPGHLGLYTGERILINQIIDPDTGQRGRSGIVKSVSYSDDKGVATMQIDNDRNRLEVFLNRLAVVTGAR